MSMDPNLGPPCRFILNPRFRSHRHLKLNMMKERSLDFLSNFLVLYLSEKTHYFSSGSSQLSQFSSSPCLILKQFPLSLFHDLYSKFIFFFLSSQPLFQSKSGTPSIWLPWGHSNESPCYNSYSSQPHLYTSDKWSFKNITSTHQLCS